MAVQQYLMPGDDLTWGGVWTARVLAGAVDLPVPQLVYARSPLPVAWVVGVYVTGQVAPDVLTLTLRAQIGVGRVTVPAEVAIPLSAPTAFSPFNPFPAGVLSISGQLTGAVANDRDIVAYVWAAPFFSLAPPVVIDER